MDRPLVSVVMPVRDAETFVGAALRSVLAQKGLAMEVVVVEDGSRDRSMEIVQGMGDERLRVVPGPKAGIAAAFNRGLEAARGEYVARCDADDRYAADRLGRQVRFLKEHPEYGAVSGAFATLTAGDAVVAELNIGRPAEETTEELRRGAVRTHFNTYLTRAGVLRAVRGCRRFFRTAEDIDLQLRLSEATRVWFEPMLCYYYRLHEASVTHSIGKACQAFYEEAARRFQAQRLGDERDDVERGVTPPLPEERGVDAHIAARHVQQMLLGRAWREHRDGRKMQAMRTGLRAALARPQTFRIWRDLVVLAMKPAPQGRLFEKNAANPPKSLSR